MREYDKENDAVSTEENVIYRTSDIYFAAFLCALDVSLQSTEKSQNSSGNDKVMFVFSIPKTKLNPLKTSYFSGTGTVKCQKYVGCLRNLKSLCFV